VRFFLFFLMADRPQPVIIPLVQKCWRIFIIRAIAFCVVAGALAVFWSPLAPTRLYDFDAVNFALSLDYFQPAAHQPQPPGYPLYVALIKIIQPFAEDVSLNFLIAGILGAAAAVVMLWVLGEWIFGRQTGILAALLLMVNPILWQTGISDQVRIYIAVISIGVALAVWPVWEQGREHPLSTRGFLVSGFVLGLLAGFRPEMLASMGPLLLIAGLRGRLRLNQYLFGALALCAGMAPWFLVLLVRVGGPAKLFAMLQIYSAEQASGSSMLFGSDTSGAWRTLSEGFWWASLGIVSWIPAAILVRWRHLSEERSKGYFLLVWFLSLFLFAISIHIAASGHALGFLPVLCLLGGWVLSEVGETRGRLWMMLCLTIALALNVLFFFRPYAERVKEASYATVAWISGNNESTMQKIDWISQQNSIILVSDNALVSWRILEYYYPGIPLIYLPAPMAHPIPPPPVWLVEKRRRIRDIDPGSEIALPSCGKVVWLVTDDSVKQELRKIKDAEDQRNFIATPAEPGMRFQVGRYHLAVSGQPCQQKH
jgi:hypothetical protein